MCERLVGVRLRAAGRPGCRGPASSTGLRSSVARYSVTASAYSWLWVQRETAQMPRASADALPRGGTHRRPGAHASASVAAPADDQRDDRDAREVLEVVGDEREPERVNVEEARGPGRASRRRRAAPPAARASGRGRATQRREHRDTRRSGTCTCHGSAWLDRPPRIGEDRDQPARPACPDRTRPRDRR